jgi:hypothetical protein
LLIGYPLRVWRANGYVFYLLHTLSPIHIYTIDISHLGHERINRQELARMIDSYQIDEVTRQSIRQDVMLEPPLFLSDKP